MDKPIIINYKNDLFYRLDSDFGYIEDTENGNIIIDLIKDRLINNNIYKVSDNINIKYIDKETIILPNIINYTLNDGEIYFNNFCYEDFHTLNSCIPNIDYVISNGTPISKLFELDNIYELVIDNNLYNSVFYIKGEEYSVLDLIPDLPNYEFNYNNYIDKSKYGYYQYLDLLIIKFIALVYAQYTNIKSANF